MLSCMPKFPSLRSSRSHGAWTLHQLAARGLRPMVGMTGGLWPMGANPAQKRHNMPGIEVPRLREIVEACW